MAARIGLVGLGYWGPNLARNFDELGALVALCDLDPELRVKFGARYPHVTLYADYAELLANPELDAIVVATPVPTHYALSKQALEAGKHVFVEKPPAMRASERKVTFELTLVVWLRGWFVITGGFRTFTMALVQAMMVSPTIFVMRTV